MRDSVPCVGWEGRATRTASSTAASCPTGHWGRHVCDCGLDNLGREIKPRPITEIRR